MKGPLGNCAAANAMITTMFATATTVKAVKAYHEQPEQNQHHNSGGKAPPRAFER